MKCCPLWLVLLGLFWPVVTARAEESTDEAAKYAPPSLEELKTALAKDADHRFDVLLRVTPRGFPRDERNTMVQLLIPVLDDEDANTRALAAQSLQLFGTEAKPALPKLVSRLGDSLASRTPTTVVAFEGVWVSMSKAIAAIGPEAIPALKDALPGSNQVEYYGISAAFSEMGTDAQSVAPVYIDILRNGPRERLWAATYTLSKLGNAALPAIPDYVANLDDENFNIQVISCRALAELGRSSQVAVPRLITLMENGILSSRTHAAMCLGSIGPVEQIDLVEAFTEMLKEINAFSQERGLIAMGRLGAHAKQAAPFVDRIIDEEYFSQKPEAAYTLYQITGETERTLSVLKRLMHDRTYDFRVHAALKNMGPAAASLAPDIASQLDTPDQSLRLTLVEILESMGPDAADQAEALRQHIPDSSREVVLAIDRALAAIEP